MEIALESYLLSNAVSSVYTTRIVRKLLVEDCFCMISKELFVCVCQFFVFWDSGNK